MPARPRLDWLAMLSALAWPLLLWAAWVLAVTWSGQPGVVCLTPAAWLLGLTVGAGVARRSSSPPGRRGLEAALTGAALGLGEGLLFAAATALWMPAETSEQARLALAWQALMPLAGAGVCALLAFIMARRLIARIQRANRTEEAKE